MNPFGDVGLLAVLRVKPGPLPDHHMLLVWIVLFNLFEKGLNPL